MDIALILKIAEVIGTVLGITAFALVTYWRLKERALVKEHNLLGNPERCKDHDDRLRDLEKACVGLCKDIENIKEDIAEIKRRLP
jgi:hypothetical protein